MGDVELLVDGIWENGNDDGLADQTLRRAICGLGLVKLIRLENHFTTTLHFCTRGSWHVAIA